MKMNLSRQYSILVPPFQLDYDSWSKKKTDQYLHWFVANAPERAVYLLKWLSLDCGHEETISPDVLLPVRTWFLNAARYEPMPLREREAQRAAFEHFGERFLSKERLDTLSEYILRDIGMLVGHIFVSNHSALFWGVDDKPKRYIFRNRPVVKGFLDLHYGKPFAAVFEPVHMVEVQCAKILDGTAKGTDLMNLYQHWAQNIP